MKKYCKSYIEFGGANNDGNPDFIVTIRTESGAMQKNITKEEAEQLYKDCKTFLKIKEK